MAATRHQEVETLAEEATTGGIQKKETAQHFQKAAKNCPRAAACGKSNTQILTGNSDLNP